MGYSQIITYCFADKISDAGIEQSDFDALMQKAQDGVAQLLEDADSGARPLFTPMDNGTDFSEIEALAQQIRSRFKHMVILGTGGSTLTGQVFQGLNVAQNRFGNSAIKIHFMDNVDPDTFEHLLTNIPLEQTCFLAISKSGNTLETMSQFVICLDKVIQQLGKKAAAERFWIISDPQDNPLRRLAGQYNITQLEHIEKIGGRFSIFTNVGLLPAAVSGLDIRAICQGAEQVISDIRQNPQSAAAVQGAVLNVLMARKGLNCAVLMPYIDRLKPLTTWVRQIWAESLGKGGKGTTMIDAIGTLDQHSQQQLYLDGPRDKLFTFITIDSRNISIKLNNDLLNDDALAYLRDSTLGDVISISAGSVYQTFISHNLPVRQIILPHLDEKILGMLAMHFIVETVLFGYLEGINPYDQPAVEDAKTLAKKMLGK